MENFEMPVLNFSFIFSIQFRTRENFFKEKKCCRDAVLTGTQGTEKLMLP